MNRNHPLLLLAFSASLAGCRCGSDVDAPTLPVVANEGSAEAADPAVEAGSGETTDATCPTVADNVVATVDCTPVMTTEDLDGQLADMVARYELLPGREPTTPEWRNERRRRFVRNAVQAAVLQRHVDEAGIVVTDAEVDAHLSDQLGHVVANPQLFERYLNSRGVTRAEYRAEVRRELALDHVLSQRGALEPTAEEIAEFYESNRDRWREGERVNARLITIRLRSDATEEQVEEARVRIEALRTRVTDGGEDFATVASTDSESTDRTRGGDRGWIVRGNAARGIEPAVEDVIFEMEPGTVSEPIRTSLGWQIYSVSAHRPEGVREIDEVRETLIEPLRRRNQQRLSRELETEITEAVDIEYYEESWNLEPEPGDAPAPPQ